MQKLSRKMNTILKTIKVFLNKKDVEKLIRVLCLHYDISLKELAGQSSEEPKEIPKTAEPQPPVAAPEPQPQAASPARQADEPDFPLEVVYYNGNRSFKRIRGAKAVGVIIPGTNKLLYYDGSENTGTRHQAQMYINNLPYKFRWHLMSRQEAEAIKKHIEQINATLRLIQGLPISGKNYMLSNDNQRYGYVRYVADL